MFELIPYGGWSKTCRLANGVIELTATLEVGPRILQFGFLGGDNLLQQFRGDLGRTGGDEFRFYGGHRLWHAPELKPRTYFPDNLPIAHEPVEHGVRLIQPVESTTGIQKEIEIRLAPGEARVELVHRLRNTNQWAVELAPWALTALSPGGVAVLPMPQRGDHSASLLPTSTLAIWAYTDLSDPRFTWGRDYILLRQDPTLTAPQKIGLLAPNGWLAYARSGLLFVKRFSFHEGASYPDRGSSAEVFVNGEMLELESLGPMVSLEPGKIVEHREEWELYRDVVRPDAVSGERLWLDVQSKIRGANAPL